jgi:hypothetical protein
MTNHTKAVNKEIPDFHFAALGMTILCNILFKIKN